MLSIGMKAVLYKRQIFADNRGSLSELYRRSRCSIEYPQVNLIECLTGCMRGIHYQEAPMAQAKLLTVISGRFVDVVVDLEDLTHTRYELVPGDVLFIPENCAHGLLALEDSQAIYLCSKEFSPRHACGLRWNDPKLGIDWGFKHPILSEADKSWELL